MTKNIFGYLVPFCLVLVSIAGIGWGLYNVIHGGKLVYIVSIVIWCVCIPINVATIRSRLRIRNK